MERALPVLKKAYLKYSEVAGKTVQYIFYDLFKDYIELKAEVLASSCFINDGKGNFKRMDLPQELQWLLFSLLPPLIIIKQTPGWPAEIFTMLFLMKGVTMRCSQPFFHTINNRHHSIYDSELASVMGQARDAKWINYAGGW